MYMFILKIVMAMSYRKIPCRIKLRILCNTILSGHQTNNLTIKLLFLRKKTWVWWIHKLSAYNIHKHMQSYALSMVWFSLTIQGNIKMMGDVSLLGISKELMHRKIYKQGTLVFNLTASLSLCLTPSKLWSQDFQFLVLLGRQLWNYWENKDRKLNERRQLYLQSQ